MQRRLAMHERTMEKNGVKNMEINRWIFNPFYYVAGVKNH